MTARMSDEEFEGWRQSATADVWDEARRAREREAAAIKRAEQAERELEDAINMNEATGLYARKIAFGQCAEIALSFDPPDLDSSIQEGIAAAIEAKAGET